MSDIICLNCFKKGHSRFSCTNQERCSRCHQVGHRAKYCSIDLKEITPTCLNCYQKGHKRSKCPLKKGYSDQDDRERRYHIDNMRWR